MSSETGKPTLYERLGGVYSIATVVDDFIDRVMRNPVLNANAAVDEGHHRVSAAGFKYYVTEMVCWATGGPQTRDINSAKREHLRIPSLLMRARAQATVRIWKKRLELQAHSRIGVRSACGLPVATGAEP